jgi:hypothetical protein
MAVLAHPLIPLVALAGMSTAALCAMAGLGTAQAACLDTILRFAWALMLILWMDADARHRRRLPCYDFGLLATISFPVSLLWYCFWSRGWRGLLVLLLLLALWLGPYVIARVFWIVRQAG